MHKELLASEAESKKWLSQIRKGSLEMCILGVIANRSRYGFEIVQHLNDSGLAMTEGTIYPLLNRLLAENLLEAQWQESASGPPRKYYCLTEKGRAAFSWMRDGWLQYATGIERILSGATANGQSDGASRPIQVHPRPSSAAE